MPEKLAKPDFTKLEKYLQRMVEAAHAGERCKAHKQYVFEEACEAFFGPKFWDWYNESSLVE